MTAAPTPAERPLKGLVRSAIAATNATDPGRVEQEAARIVRACGRTHIGSRRVVELVRAFSDVLPDTRGDLSELRRTADALEEHLATSGAAPGSCLLGPALLAMATHLTGRTPHHRPDAHGASPTTLRAATVALGWALSPDPTERLVAAITASAPALVEPLLDDPERLVRAAAELNRSGGAGVRPRGSAWEVTPTDEEPPAAGVAALQAMRRVLGAAGLRVPDVAARFARAWRLHRYDDWHYASKPLPGAFEDYRFGMSAERLLGPVQDQLAISHAGHGINSYALNLRLAVGPVAVMAQVGWGGVYDGPDAGEEWDVLTEGVDLLTDGIALDGWGGLERRRWLVLHSPLGHGELPTLLRRDGDRWIVPDEIAAQDRHAGESHRPDLDEVRERWALIRRTVARDLHVHEQAWAHDPETSMLDPRDPEPERVFAIVDHADTVLRLEFDADDGLLERRGGVWERTEERDPCSAAARLRAGHRQRVDAEAIARFDAAELAGLRLPIAALIDEDGGHS